MCRRRSRWCDGGDWAVTFEYGWLVLYDTVGESETRLRTGRIVVAWVLD